MLRDYYVACEYFSWYVCVHVCRICSVSSVCIRDVETRGEEEDEAAVRSWKIVV